MEAMHGQSAHGVHQHNPHDVERTDLTDHIENEVSMFEQWNKIRTTTMIQWEHEAH